MGQVRVGRAVTLYRHPQKVDIEAEEWKTKLWGTPLLRIWKRKGNTEEEFGEFGRDI